MLIWALPASSFRGRETGSMGASHHFQGPHPGIKPVSLVSLCFSVKKGGPPLQAFLLMELCHCAGQGGLGIWHISSGSALSLRWSTDHLAFLLTGHRVSF